MLRGISFVVPFKPMGKERPRMGMGGRFYTPPRTREYENLVATHAAIAMGFERPLEGRVVLQIELYPDQAVVCVKELDRPKPAGRLVDLDNAAKALADAMIGIVYKDDSQIDHLEITRHG
jgi:Holliday junction resolvase RusA-like endonuclease